MRDTYRYYVLAYEDAPETAHQTRARGTTVLTGGAEAIGRAEALAKEFPEGWGYIHVEYTGKKE